MSRPDLLSALRESRPAPPPELRERVRLIGSAASAPSRSRVTRRRAVIVVVPVVAALAAAVVLTQGSEKQPTPTPRASVGAVEKAPTLAPALGAEAVPAPAGNRAQRYSATLELRERSDAALSDATKRATEIASSLAGYPLRLDVHTIESPGSADLVFRIPRVHVEDAVRRFTALGTIVSEDVSIEDVQAQVNATSNLIARLQRQLGTLRVEEQTPTVQRQITALTARVQRLQRGRAATLSATHFATVELRLTTESPAPAPVRHAHGPLHGLGIAFHWLWIGAVYALALGAPVAAALVAVWLAARRLRRRREDALLSRS